MAKLRERDLERILGPDWKIKMGIAGPGRGKLQAEMDAKRRHDSLSDGMFTAGGAFAIGIGLVISSLSTMKGTTFWGWFAFAILVIAGSTIRMLSLKRKVRANARDSSTPTRLQPVSDTGVVLDSAQPVKPQ